MSLSRWRKFIESETALQVARVCRFYGIDPATYLHDLEDGPVDSFEQLALAEALMLRLQVWEKNQLDAAEDERKREDTVAKSLSDPGSQQRVQPPTPEEVAEMLKQRG